MATALQLEAQARWETEGVTRAVRRYREAADSKDPSELPSGQALLRELVPPLSAAIATAQATVLAKSGHQAEYAWMIQLLDSDKLAVITIASALRSLTSHRNSLEKANAANQAHALATAVRLQVEFERWQEGADPVALRALQARYPDVRKAVWERWRRKVEGLQKETWTAVMRVHLGTALLHLLADTAPHRFSIVTRNLPGGKTGLFLEISEATVELMRDREARAEVARPMLLPMIIPPNPWRYD